MPSSHIYKGNCGLVTFRNLTETTDTFVPSVAMVVFTRIERVGLGKEGSAIWTESSLTLLGLFRVNGGEIQFISVCLKIIIDRKIKGRLSYYMQIFFS